MNHEWNWQAQIAWLQDPLLWTQILLCYALPWTVLSLALGLLTRLWIWGLTMFLGLFLLAAFFLWIHLAVGPRYEILYRLDRRQVSCRVRYPIRQETLYRPLCRLATALIRRPCGSGLGLLRRPQQELALRWSVFYQSQRIPFLHILLLHHGPLRQLALRCPPEQEAAICAMVEPRIRREDPAQEKMR